MQDALGISSGELLLQALLGWRGEKRPLLHPVQLLHEVKVKDWTLQSCSGKKKKKKFTQGYICCQKNNQAKVISTFQISSEPSIFLGLTTPTAYGGSKARGLIRAIVSSLHHTYSNTRSQLHLGPMLQLLAMPDP